MQCETLPVYYKGAKCEPRPTLADGAQVGLVSQAHGVAMPQSTYDAMTMPKASCGSGMTLATSEPVPAATMVAAMGRSCAAVMLSNDRWWLADILLGVSFCIIWSSGTLPTAGYPS